MNKGRLRLPIPPLGLQQSMNGLGLAAGELRHALGSPTGRRRQRHPQPPVLHHGNNAFYGCGLAGTRAAGQNQQTLLGSDFNGSALLLVQLNAISALIGQDLGSEDLALPGRVLGHHPNPLPNPLLRLINMGQKQKRLSIHLFLHQLACLQGVVQRHLCPVLGHIQPGHRCLDHLAPGEAGMAVLQIILHHIDHRCLIPIGWVRRLGQLLCDLLGPLKGNALIVAGDHKGIGILRQDLRCFRPKKGKSLKRLSLCKAHPGQRFQRLAGGKLIFVLPADLLGHTAADAL